MPQDNGNERDARLARMEAAQETFQRDLQQLLTAQVLQQDALEKQSELLQKHVEQSNREFDQLRAHGKQVDERIDKLGERIEQLVSGIGEFIRRSPVRE